MLLLYFYIYKYIYIYIYIYLHIYNHGSSPPSFRRDLKISDQNNWGGPEQKIKFGGGAKFKRGPKILGGGVAMNPNDIMVVVLRDMLIRF